MNPTLEKTGPGRTGIEKSDTIMGIDPGLASTGVGVIAPDGRGGWRKVYSGHVITTRLSPMPKRLETIHRLVSDAITAHRPTVVALESVFFAKNVKSAVLMAHGRGAAILATALSGVPVTEYSPLEIKQSVIGKGRGSKDQVMRMVQVLLQLDAPPASDHEADALACALCHAYRSRLPGLIASVEVPESDAAAERKALLAQAFTRKRRRR